MPIERTPPITIPPSKPPSDHSKSAIFIFLHGLGDDAEGVQNIAHQFHAAAKLPHISFLFPNALENRDAMSTAWFTPTRLSPLPPSRPELEDAEDEDGILHSVAYVESLIHELIAQGVPARRIVVGGFSQGAAVSLLIGLVSGRWSGRVGGVVGLSGYLPLVDRIGELREGAGLGATLNEEEGRMEVFLARGTKDMLVPSRYFRTTREKLGEVGVKEERVTVREYEGMGHVISGVELRDLCAWLERVVPGIE